MQNYAIILSGSLHPSFSFLKPFFYSRGAGTWSATDGRLLHGINAAMQIKKHDTCINMHTYI